MGRQILDVVMAVVLALWLFLAPDMLYNLFGPFGIVLTIVACFGITIDTVIHIWKGR